MKKSLIVLLAVSVFASGLMKAAIKDDLARHETTMADDGRRIGNLEDTTANFIARLSTLEGNAVVAGIPAGPRDVLLALAKVASQLYFNNYIFYSFWLAAAMMTTDQQSRDWAYSWVYSELEAKSNRPVCMYGCVESAARVLAEFASTVRHPAKWISEHPYLAMFQLLAFEEAVLGYAEAKTLLGSIIGWGAPKAGRVYGGVAGVGAWFVDKTAKPAVRVAGKVPGFGRVIIPSNTSARSEADVKDVK